MTDSLRDQLLKLGFKKPEPPVRAPTPPQRPTAQPGKPHARLHGNSEAAIAPNGRAPRQHPARPGAPAPNGGRPQRSGPGPQRPAQPARSQEEIDLAKAYALRDRLEREERERAKREAETKARERREKRLQLRGLLQGKSLNDAEADLMRHFPHSGKIKRVHVNAEQLLRLNAGELGVVQSDGHYLLVDRETALAVRELYAEALLLLPEPGDASEDDWGQPMAAEPAAT